jgi:hypothetical protein
MTQLNGILTRLTGLKKDLVGGSNGLIKDWSTLCNKACRYGLGSADLRQGHSDEPSGSIKIGIF